MVSTINIDVTQDLGNASHLKQLLSSNFKPSFAIATELASYAGKPIKSAVGCNQVAVSINAPGEWKTSTGICFSLTPSAKCTIAVAKASSACPVATSIRSTQTQNVTAGPMSGKVYVNIDLDFQISGTASGSGNAGGVCISGKATGSSTTTFSHCIPVDETKETVAAIKEAFSSLVFPLQPDCALVMPVGSLARVNFDGCLGFELDASYGLGSFRFSAPGVSAAQQSLKAGMEKLALPSAEVEIGATASFSYQHSDHFGAIICKQDATQATLYLVRSGKDEFHESAKVSVEVSEGDKLAATVDKAKLTKAVDGITGQPGTGDKVAGVSDELQASLADKANEWLSGKNTEASLAVALAQQTNRVLLYAFKVDLTKAALAQQSWIALAKGNVALAAKIGGMTLLPGSGVGHEFKRTVSIDLHFFNLYKADDTESYFRNSYVEIGPDGSVRFLYDVGKEEEVDTKKAMHKCRFHFVATANSGANQTVQGAEVDLWIELSESDDPTDARRIANILVPLGASVSQAQAQMSNFSANKKGKLNLINIFKPTAYGRLTSSPYVGGKPPHNPQAEDSRNFAAFHIACVTLLQWPFLAALSYADWVRFNEYSNNPSTIVDNNPNAVPDRRAPGDISAVPASFFANRETDRLNIAYCYQNYADFMNLCDDLHSLAGVVGKLDTDQTEAEWQDLLKLLTHMVKNSLDADFSKAAACALLQLCHGATATTALLPGADKSSLTCTVTLA